MKSAILGVFFALSLLISTPQGQAQESSYAGEVINSTSRGIAIDGFDTVAYFTKGAPAKGEQTYRHVYKDRVWLFASAENRDLFISNPEKYAPQNNGWCSWAVAHDYAAEADFIDGWFITDGLLYVTWSKEIKERFLENRDQLISQSQSNWSTVHNGLKDGTLAKFGTHASRPGLGLSHPQQLPESDT